LSLKTKADGLSVAWPQNHWDGLLVVWAQNHWNNLLVVWPENHWAISPDLALKPVAGFLV
jgi:hypothetical protein